MRIIRNRISVFINAYWNSNPFPLRYFHALADKFFTSFGNVGPASVT